MDGDSVASMPRLGASAAADPWLEVLQSGALRLRPPRCFPARSYDLAAFGDK